VVIGNALVSLLAEAEDENDALLRVGHFLAPIRQAMDNVASDRS
jgi:hypothetical protein